MNDLVLDHVSKRYQVRRRSEANTGRRSLLQRLQALRAHADEFWALRDISFEVARGETLGIIGHNGAGKSTILKLLSKVTAPTSGEIRISGRLSALIEVGSGFHPELTGRENIYLSGSILGMRRREIGEKLEGIIEFAGVRDFIDTPVKHYSSGMYVRLGFSIAAHLEPDILLLDEVLAVGDATFQAKCLDRINRLHTEGRTIVFISHDVASVERLCGRVLLLNHGQVIASGPARDLIETYWEIGRTRRESEQMDRSAECSREVEITSVTCHDATSQEANAFRTGSPVTVRVKYVAHTTVADAIVELYMHSVVAGQYGASFQLTTAAEEHGDRARLEEGEGAVEFDIDELGLLPGLCHISARILHRDQPSGRTIDWRQQCLTLRVDPGKRVRGTFYTPHRWRIITGSRRLTTQPMEHGPLSGARR
jgi:ABC-type polysaccharide/polyol phosphate transport system ATPase subunit